MTGVERARTLLRAGRRASQKVVADESGFSNPAQMRRAFSRVLGLKLQEVRLLFGGASEPTSPEAALAASMLTPRG